MSTPTNNAKITPQQRAQLFGAATRQHWQMLGTQTANGGSSTLSFRVPKVRLLQSVKLLVEATINVKGSAAYTFTGLEPYALLRRVQLDLNNGFAPVVASAEEIAMINLLKPNGAMIFPAADDTTLCKVSNAKAWNAASGGTDNTIKFALDLPLTLNERDPVGLILAQNAETAIDINCDIANGGELVKHKDGYTVAIKEVKITPMVCTFSVPASSAAFPDLSVLKIVDSRTEVFSGSGLKHVKLPTGQIYRKMIFAFADETGAPMTDDGITSNLEITFNTADVPYSVSPAMLRMVNKMQLGYELPKGVYALPLDWQGIPNYGGSRDYIDSESITELTLRFNSAAGGSVRIITEKLSRLK